MIGFGLPWALVLLPLLPGLWWLLRVVPPPPRLVLFPAVRLLFGLEAREESAARTPPLVLALRVALALCLILALARPLINPGPVAAGGGPLLLAIDDDWAAAGDWDQRRAWADDQLAAAERAGRAVALLPTAPPTDGGPVAATDLLPAAQARERLRALAPQPWPADRAAAARAAGALPHAQAIWLADGVDDPHAAELVRALGPNLVVAAGRPGHILLPPADDADPSRLLVTVRRAGRGGSEAVVVRALDDSGRVLGRQDARFTSGAAEAGAEIHLPLELRNTLVRLDIENEAGTGAVVLLDERWHRRPVGLVESGGGTAAALLDHLTYIDKALAPVADLHRGELADLLGSGMAVLMLADLADLRGGIADRLAEWIDQGGVLVRTAGPLLAAAQGAEPDRFLPVRLLAGGRMLGGAMSWSVPQHLAPFPPHSPFVGLAVPDEVTVSAQVLAEPALDLVGRTWAQLADGTPLVTAERRGKGWVVLLHTSANAEWSTLPLSGLFPAMLQRLVMLAEGLPGQGGGTLAPLETLDGFGRLGLPGAAAIALGGGNEIGPRHPPGFYGGGGVRVALNLGPDLGQPGPLALPPGTRRAELSLKPHEIDLQPYLLVVSIILFLADMAVAQALRGLWRAPLIAALLLAFSPAQAADSDAFALESGLTTRLAYVRTGDVDADAKSRAGLAALSRLVAARSTAHLGEPMAINLEADPLVFFPLLYWPVTATQPPPSAAASAKLASYLRHGGLIVFDAADPLVPQAARLAELTRGLALPPLVPLGSDHVLTRAFYLLKDLPGRAADAGVWVEDGAAANDGVSPVVVASSDWAGAWATDDQGRPLFAVVPGGERQREMAYRVGINLVMYALTGNYKADQIHLPAILERVRR